MELDSGKKSRTDSMMRLISFDTQEMKDRSEGSRRVDRLSRLMDKINGRCLPDERKTM